MSPSKHKHPRKISEENVSSTAIQAKSIDFSPGKYFGQAGLRQLPPSWYRIGHPGEEAEVQAERRGEAARTPTRRPYSTVDHIELSYDPHGGSLRYSVERVGVPCRLEPRPKLMQECAIKVLEAEERYD